MAATHTDSFRIIHFSVFTVLHADLVSRQLAQNTRDPKYARNSGEGRSTVGVCNSPLGLQGGLKQPCQSAKVQDFCFREVHLARLQSNTVCDGRQLLP